MEFSRIYENFYYYLADTIIKSELVEIENY